MALSYVSGNGVLVAAHDFIVFLPDGAKPQILRQLWEQSSAAAHRKGFLGVLQAVTSSLDPTLENLPRFAIVELGKRSGEAREIRIAVSGDTLVEVSVAHKDELLTLRGNGVAMWLEEQILDALSVRFCAQCDEAVDGEAPTEGFPLREGVVLAAGAVWRVQVNDDSGCFEALVEDSQIAVEESFSVDVDAVDDDFGRTIAEIPEEWLAHDAAEEQEPAAPIVNVVSGASPGDSGSGDVRVRETEVLSVSRIDVAPTEVVAQKDSSSGDSAVADSGEQSRRGRYAAATQVMSPPVMGSVGFVRFSHGEVVELGVPLVVGRKPTHEGSGAVAHARMISVPSPSKDISRNHVEIRVEHSHVLVTDLGSVNGTLLRRQGALERSLAAHEATLVINGDVIDLGDGVTLTFDQLR
ncbi:FHA domain-containing protein [Timonella sp. A28]|uniref:FHA domain-containing protein n=1 Tax=Timonella sp. A28 TaxID=3442640 RepID=UPI003EBE549E